MKYFILMPRGANIYAAASRRALRTYATHIQDENPELCAALRKWVDTETFEATEGPRLEREGSDGQ